MEQINIYLARKGIKGLVKGQAIMRSKGNTDWPIAYIRKSKIATDKEYWQILNSLFPNFEED